MADVFDPAAVLSLLLTLLPRSSTLKTPQDAISALMHAAMSVLGFRLVGITDDSTISQFPSNVLPDNWNTHGPGNYTFRYRHEQSALEFIVKVSKLAGRTVINAIALQSDKTATLDIQTEDYTSPSFFPHVLSEDGTKPLVHGYISSNRVADLLQNYKLKIVQKLVPGLRKEGYDESVEASPAEGSQSRPASQTPQEPYPRRGNRDPSSSHPSVIPQNPLSIGRRDLDPLVTQPNQFVPPPLFGGPSGGDGMYVGPDHPIFSDRFTPGRGGIGGGGNRQGPWGGDGFLPPLGAPPGARFDPVGPFGTPPGRGPGRGGPLGRYLGGPGGFGAHEPDNDEFLPPGAGDMFS